MYVHFMKSDYLYILISDVHVIVVTQARVLCLICTDEHEGAQCLRVSVQVWTYVGAVLQLICYTSGNAAVLYHHV